MKGWILIYVMFNQFVGVGEHGNFSIHQKSPTVYSTPDDCHQQLLELLASEDMAFDVRRFDTYSSADSLNQSSKDFILGHQYRCMPIDD
jgi:hypothetical protein